MGISYINHNGKKVLYIDYSKCKTVEETLNVLEEVKKEYLKTTGLLITLNDFTGAYGSSEYMKKANEYAKEVFNNKTAKNAAIGVTGIKKILLQAYNVVVKDKLQTFETKEEALNYLTT